MESSSNDQQILERSPNSEIGSTIERVRRMLSVIPRPPYGDWIKIISAVLDAVDSDKGMATNLLKEWCPEEKEGEYEDKLDNPLDRVTEGTLYHHARKHGYEDNDSSKLILDCLNQDERGDAILFATLVRHRCLFDFDLRAYVRFINGVWVEDRKEESLRELPEILRSEYLNTSSLLDENIVSHSADEKSDQVKKLSRQRDNLRKRARHLNSKMRIQHVSDLAKREIACTRKEFDSDNHLFNLANGTYNLTSDTFRPHDAADRMSMCSIINYDPNATALKWHGFLDEIFSHDVELVAFMQSWIGYVLSGSTDQDLLLFLYGTGANGKSTFISVIEMLLGDYFLSMPIDTLLAKQGSSTDQYHIAKMRGKRCCVASEVPAGRRLNEPLIKDLAGGDTLTARNPYGRPFNFRQTHKLMLVGNHKPVIKGADTGIWRRICVVPFTVQIPKGKRILRSKLLTSSHPETIPTRLFG